MMTAARDGRPHIRQFEDLDAETLHLVSEFLGARAQRRAVNPAWVAAWEQFFLTYEPLIRFLVQGRSHHVRDQEDCIQEVWRAIVIRFPRYDPRRGPFHCWLRTLVQHVIQDQGRTVHRLRYLDMNLEEQLSSREADPVRLFEEKQAVREIEPIMQKLRSRVSTCSYRIVYGHLVEGKSYAEIASSLGLTVKQVRDRHGRTMPKLRELLRTDGRF
jgi:RNA polymerase sigma factor (sigma-70 family)